MHQSTSHLVPFLINPIALTVYRIRIRPPAAPQSIGGDPVLDSRGSHRPPSLHCSVMLAAAGTARALLGEKGGGLGTGIVTSSVRRPRGREDAGAFPTRTFSPITTV
jgi:hypothetical protein